MIEEKRWRYQCKLGLRGAPKISVLRGSEGTVRVSVPEFRISVRFLLYITLSKQQWLKWKIIFLMRLATVNDLYVNFETFTAASILCYDFITGCILYREVNFRVSFDQWQQRNLWIGHCPALSRYDRLSRKAESGRNSHVHHCKTSLY